VVGLSTFGFTRKNMVDGWSLEVRVKAAWGAAQNFLILHFLSASSFFAITTYDDITIASPRDRYLHDL